uniref:Inositol oxygenase n=1 Tax=Falco tinnunculus TaxID=100819 RepID=A0A8C4V1M7_FALTI
MLRGLSLSTPEPDAALQEGKLLDRVYNTYLLMHTHQTVDFVRKKVQALPGHCSLRKMSIMEALELLDQLVDESDPDVDFPNSYHAYQTAEGIRQAHPDKDWFHLVGLLHDLGKVLALFGEPQWAVVGDTFPVGCKVQKSVVFSDSTFHDNPDTRHPLYSTEYGMYQPRCGLENILMSWGHDEYMYRVMKFNNFTLPKEAFYMVRFHSFYPWHTHGDYQHLCTEEDLRMLPWVRELKCVAWGGWDRTGGLGQAPPLQGEQPPSMTHPCSPQQVRPLHQAGGAA